jgi:hypothetical protein
VAEKAIPTLFRQPGPEALRAFLEGRLRRLAPAEATVLWLHERPAATRPGATRAFGVLAVLDPRRFAAHRAGRGIWRAENRPCSGAEVVWTPPSALKRPILWSRLNGVDAARRHFGGGYGDERARVLESIAAYLEEVSSLERAGVRSDIAWCERPCVERRRVLERHAIRGRWTR